MVAVVVAALNLALRLCVGVMFFVNLDGANTDVIEMRRLRIVHGDAALIAGPGARVWLHELR